MTAEVIKLVNGNEIIELTINEVRLIIKLCNPAVFEVWQLDFNSNPLEYLKYFITTEYMEPNFKQGEKILYEALNKFKKLAGTKSDINFGDFIRLLYIQKITMINAS